MFIKRTTEELKEGMRISIAGRIAEIVEATSTKIDGNFVPDFHVVWEDNGFMAWITLESFPDLLIEKPEVKISKEAADKIHDWLKQPLGSSTYPNGLRGLIDAEEILTFIRSMTE